MELFRSTGAYLQGHFRLTSGLHSAEYLQCALVLQHPQAAEKLGRMLAEAMREIGKRHGRSPGEVAIAWTLRNPGVTGAIVGARNARQATGVMKAGELRLSDKEVNEIEEVAEAA